MGMVNKNRSYGSTNSAGEIWTHIGNRTPADAMRTLCHELIHHKQFELGTARDDMDDEQRLKIEDEANAIAGRMLRTYGKIDGSIYESAATAATSYVLFAAGKKAMRFNSEREAKKFIEDNKLDSRYVLKKQVCRCTYQPLNESTVGNAKLKKQLLKHKKTDYDSIDKMMTSIAKQEDITPKQLHDNWVDEYGVTPDTWIKRQLKNKGK
jgi:hypothetical protein